MISPGVSDVSFMHIRTCKTQLYIVIYMAYVITPRAHARARGYVIGRGVCFYIYICKDFFLSFKILTFRRPFQHRKASLRI